MSDTPKEQNALFKKYGTGTYGTGLYSFYQIPVGKTEEGQQRLRNYYEALGRFVDAFSQVEIAVALTLRHYARTSPEIANVAFASVKVDQGTSMIKQLAKATKAEQHLRHQR